MIWTVQDLKIIEVIVQTRLELFCIFSSDVGNSLGSDHGDVRCIADCDRLDVEVSIGSGVINSWCGQIGVVASVSLERTTCGRVSCLLLACA